MKNILLTYGITILFIAGAFESIAQPSAREDRKMLAKNSSRTTGVETQGAYNSRPSKLKYLLMK
jgi:hypothetical protein